MRWAGRTRTCEDRSQSPAEDAVVPPPKAHGRPDVMDSRAVGPPPAQDRGFLPATRHYPADRQPKDAHHRRVDMKGRTCGST